MASRKPIKHERNVGSIKRHRSINRGSQRERRSIDGGRREGEAHSRNLAERCGCTWQLYVNPWNVRSDSCNFTASCHHPIYNAHPLFSPPRAFSIALVLSNFPALSSLLLPILPYRYLSDICSSSPSLPFFPPFWGGKTLFTKDNFILELILL